MRFKHRLNLHCIAFASKLNNLPREVKYPCDNCQLICLEYMGLSATELRCLPPASRLLKFQCSKCRSYDAIESLQNHLQDKDQIKSDKNDINMLQEKIKLLEEEKNQHLTQSYAEITKINKTSKGNNCPNIIIKPKAAQSQ